MSNQAATERDRFKVERRLNNDVEGMLKGTRADRPSREPAVRWGHSRQEPVSPSRRHAGFGLAGRWS